jgi:hypothetical protein
MPPFLIFILARHLILSRNILYKIEINLISKLYQKNQVKCHFSDGSGLVSNEFGYI